MKSLMTIVVPCYNEEAALPLFLEAIMPIREALAGGTYCSELMNMPSGEPSVTNTHGSALSSNTGNNAISFTPCDTELIFIDDGSKDSTLKLLREYHAQDSSVRYISFSRNFGKEAGIYAGLRAAKGDYVVLLDADLQHPVEFIPRMYCILTGRADKLQSTCDLNAAYAVEYDSDEKYDSVAMYRKNRGKSGRIRAFFSKRFFRAMNKLSKINLIDGATDYRMMSRRMVDSILEMQEYNRFTKGIFNWVGFNTFWLPYEDVERCAGTSKWSFGALLRYGFEGMFAFSTTPLTISFTLGVILCVLALIYAVITVIKTLVWGNPVAGYPSLFTMILLLGGIQLLFLGLMGQYMSRMYMEVKHRPVYIARETSEDD